MSDLTRFGVSLEKALLEEFDRALKEQNYSTRSKAIGDLIRQSLAERRWKKGKASAGAITLVYNHHKKELLNKLISIQHDYHNLIISSQHVHLDHDQCLEIIAVKGNPGELESLYLKLKSEKGVGYASLTSAMAGKIK